MVGIKTCVLIQDLKYNLKRKASLLCMFHRFFDSNNGVKHLSNSFLPKLTMNFLYHKFSTHTYIYRVYCQNNFFSKTYLQSNLILKFITFIILFLPLRLHIYQDGDRNTLHFSFHLISSSIFSLSLPAFFFLYLSLVKA